jgi:hypothetical protein
MEGKQSRRREGGRGGGREGGRRTWMMNWERMGWIPKREK